MVFDSLTECLPKDTSLSLVDGQKDNLKDVCDHKWRSRHILRVRRFLPEFPQTCPKSFLCDFCLQTFSHKDHKDVFSVWPPKEVFMCFFAKVGRHFLKSSTIFAQIFRDFAQNFRDFARIFNKSKLVGVRLHTRLIHHCLWLNKRGEKNQRFRTNPIHCLGTFCIWQRRFGCLKRRSFLWLTLRLIKIAQKIQLPLTTSFYFGEK